MNPMLIFNEILKNFALMSLKLVFINFVKNSSTDSFYEMNVHKFSKLFQHSVLVNSHNRYKIEQYEEIEAEPYCQLYTEVDFPPPPPPAILEDYPTDIDLPRPPSGLGTLEDLIFETECSNIDLTKHFVFDEQQYPIPPPSIFENSEPYLEPIATIQAKAQEIPFDILPKEESPKIKHLQTKPKTVETPEKQRLLARKNSERKKPIIKKSDMEKLHTELKKAVYERCKRLKEAEGLTKRDGNDIYAKVDDVENLKINLGDLGTNSSATPHAECSSLGNQVFLSGQPMNTGSRNDGNKGEIIAKTNCFSGIDATKGGKKVNLKRLNAPNPPVRGSSKLK